MTKLSGDDVKALSLGSALIYCSTTEGNVEKFPAVIKMIKTYRADLDVYMGERHPTRIPWSFKTNQPVGKSRGYLGTVWLERSSGA